MRLRIDDARVPLVLAAVDSLVPVYREVSRYQNLVPDGVTGYPDGSTAQQLHDKAWRILEPRFGESRNRAAEQYRQLRAKGLASCEMSEALWAAKEGRVEVLLGDARAHLWGRLDEPNRAV